VTTSLPAISPAVAPRLRETYDAHAAFVVRCLRYLGVPSSELDDALQEVFLVVHRRLSSFQPGTSFRSWLYAIALNVARHARRSRQPQPPDGAPEPSDASSDARRVEARLEVLGLLATLDDEKREVVVLYHLEQLTLQEIADATGVPLQTAYSRLKAGVKLLEEAKNASRKVP
jgi:RNA polymerase sigma-70 factor, ECF subfamily